MTCSHPILLCSHLWSVDLDKEWVASVLLLGAIYQFKRRWHRKMINSSQNQIVKNNVEKNNDTTGEHMYFFFGNSLLL